jgi:hypothetical protein
MSYYTPYLLRETYSSLHAVEFKQVDAENYTLVATWL